MSEIRLPRFPAWPSEVPKGEDAEATLRAWKADATAAFTKASETSARTGDAVAREDIERLPDYARAIWDRVSG